MKNQRGFVLLSVLILLSVIFAAMLYGQENEILLAHLVHNQDEQDKLNAAFQEIRPIILRKIMNHEVECFWPFVSTEFFQHLSEDWWIANGCHERQGDISVYYIVSPLFSSHYYVAFLLKNQRMLFVNEVE